MKKNIKRKNRNIRDNIKKIERHISDNQNKGIKSDIIQKNNCNDFIVNSNRKINIDTCNCNDDCNCTINGSICYCLDIRKASQNVTKMYSEALKPTKLTPTQFGILKRVQTIGPVNVTNLANQMGLDRTTLVRSLKILENKGFIEDISQNNERNRKLILSKSGDEVLQKATILWRSAQKKLEKHLGKNDLQKMLELISKLENI